MDGWRRGGLFLHSQCEEAPEGLVVFVSSHVHCQKLENAEVGFENMTNYLRNTAALLISEYSEAAVYINLVSSNYSPLYILFTRIQVLLS
jgi:hypothetical protein